MPSDLSNKEFYPLSHFFSSQILFESVLFFLCCGGGHFFLINFETTEMVETITFPQYLTVSESFLQGLYQTEPCVTHTKWMNKPRIREAKELHMQGHTLSA